MILQASESSHSLFPSVLCTSGNSCGWTLQPVKSFISSKSHDNGSLKWNFRGNNHTCMWKLNALTLLQNFDFMTNSPKHLHKYTYSSSQSDISSTSGLYFGTLSTALPFKSIFNDSSMICCVDMNFSKLESPSKALSQDELRGPDPISCHKWDVSYFTTLKKKITNFYVAFAAIYSINTLTNECWK